MSRYPQGQPIYLSTTLKNRSGVLTNDATLALQIQNPDLTLQNFASPTNDSTGLYHQDIPAADLTQFGHYMYVWTSTGTCAGISRGDFDVFDPYEPSILPLQDAKDAINILQTDTSYDNEIQAYLDTITTAIEMVTGGPAFNRTITERVKVTHGYEAFVLRKRPVVSLTSVTDISSGAALPVTDAEIDTNAGIVRRKLRLPWLSWGPYYTIVYVAGWGTAIPAAFNVAARMIFTHLWQTQRGPGLHPMAGLEDTILPGMSFAIPNRALEVLRPFTIEVAI